MEGKLRKDVSGMAKQFNDINFNEEVLESKTPVLVDFYADWCGPCKMMAPIVEELAAEYEGKAIIGKLNVDESGSTAQTYKVMSIPTMILFKDGQAVDKVVGTVSKADLTEKINKVLKVI